MKLSCLSSHSVSRGGYIDVAPRWASAEVVVAQQRGCGGTGSGGPGPWPPQERRVPMEDDASPGYPWRLDDVLHFKILDTVTDGAAQVGCGRVHETG